MNLFRSFFSSVTASFLLLTPLISFAQTATPNSSGLPTGFTAETIPQDLQEQSTFTKINPVPFAYVTDISASVQGTNTVQGSFVVQNTEQAAIGDIQYEFFVLKPLPDVPVGTLVIDDGTVLARFRQAETFALQAQEEKTVPFSYQAPALPDGDYRFRVQLITSNDRRLGWHDTTVRLSGGKAFTVIEPNVVKVSSVDPITNTTKEEWDPLEGPNVMPKQSMVLHAFATNIGTESVTGTIQLATKRILLSNEETKTDNYDTITIAPNETKEISLPIAAQENAGSYRALLSVVSNSAIQTNASGIGEFRYVVKGLSASIASQLLTELPQEQGKNATISFTIAGAADRATSINGTLEAVLRDDKGELGRVENTLTLQGATPQQGTATIPLGHSRCGIPSLTLTVKTSEGVTLDSYTTSYPNLVGTLCDKAASQVKPTSWILIGALLAALLLVASVIGIIKHRSSQTPLGPSASGANPTNISLLLLAITTLVLGSLALKGASTQANGIQYVYVNEDPNNPNEQVRPELFISSPVHNATVGGPNKQGQLPADPSLVNYSGRFTWINCDNHRTLGYFEVYAKSDGGKTDWHANKQWTQLGRNSIYMPQTCHCNNRIRRGVEVNGTFKLPGYTPGGSTTIWSYGNSEGSWRNGAVLQDFTWVNFFAPPTATPTPKPTSSPGASTTPTPSASSSATPTPSTTGADVSLSITAPSSVGRGSLLNYSLQIRNQGPQTAQTVAVQQNIPANMRFNSSSSSRACNQQGQTVRCNLGTLVANESSLLSIVFDVENTATCNSKVTGTATASSTTSDPNQSNNSATSSETTITCGQCQDGVDNDNDGRIDTLDPACHVNYDITKPYDSSRNSENDTQCTDIIDNEGDGLADDKDPNCHVGSDIDKAYVPSHNNESGGAPFDPGGFRETE